MIMSLGLGGSFFFFFLEFSKLDLQLSSSIEPCVMNGHVIFGKQALF